MYTLPAEFEENIVREQPTFDNDTEVALSFKKLAKMSNALMIRIESFSEDDMLTEEGIVDGFSKLVRDIGNLFSRIYFTVKTNLFDVFKDLKRSALREYHESNILSVKAVLSIPYEELKPIEIPIPTGMKVNYLEYMTVADRAITSLGLINDLSVMKQSIIRISTGIKSSTVDSKFITLYCQQCVTKLDTVKKQINHLNTLRNKKNTTEFLAPFKKVFSSAEEFRNTNELIMKMEDVFTGISKITNTMHEIDQHVELIIRGLDDGSVTLSKNDMLALAKIMNALAYMFDMHGYLANEASEVEHNFVNVLVEIRKIKMI